MAKKYDSGPSLQEKILEGVDILANNVASTLGPRGRNVILYQKGSNPIIKILLRTPAHRLLNRLQLKLLMTAETEQRLLRSSLALY